MRVFVLVPLIAALGVAACSRVPFLPERPRGGSGAALIYADPGTKLTLSNTVNGATRETDITAAWSLGARGIYRDEDGREASFLPGCWGCGNGTELDEDAYTKLWPLRRGNRVTFARTNRDGTVADVVITVMGTEDLTTPGGTYKTFILEGRVENRGGPQFSAQMRAWWAPVPGWVVKAEGGDSRGNTLSSEVTQVIYP